MARARTISLTLLVGVLAALVQLVLRPLISVTGLLRSVSPLNNQNCTTDVRLQGCEDLVLDEPSGLLYLACSDPSHVAHWLPYFMTFDARAVQADSYIAQYDPATARLTRLEIAGYPVSARPFAFAFHGIDVVRSAADPRELFVYAVNHRAPLVGDAADVGADSCVEIFRMREGAGVLTHVATVADPAVVVTPNDVVGSPDGKSFWVTNDYASRTNKLYRTSEMYLGLPVTTVGYCDVGQGCKVAAGGLLSCNGIARRTDGSGMDTFLVSSTMGGFVYVFSRLPDNTLVITDKIKIGLVTDNLSVDSEGAVWTASFPKGMTVQARAENPSVLSPSAAFRLREVGSGSDESFQVDRVFEDNGTLTPATTVAVHDVRRGLLYLHSCYSDHLTICKI